MPFPPFRSRLEAGETLFAAWTMMDGARIAETLVAGGWDAVIVDMQHGSIDYQPMLAMVQVIAREGVPALVRVPLDAEGMIGRALDAGSSGIICPMINSGRDGAWLAQAAKFPPLGTRSWGPAGAMTAMKLDKEDYLSGANAETLAFAMIETRGAVDALDAILGNEGVDGVFVGPNDLNVSLSAGKTVDPTDARTMEAVEKIAQRARTHRRFAGIYANTPELARAYAEMGYGFIAVGNDRGYLAEGARLALERAKG